MEINLNPIPVVAVVGFAAGVLVTLLAAGMGAVLVAIWEGARRWRHAEDKKAADQGRECVLCKSVRELLARPGGAAAA